MDSIKAHLSMKITPTLLKAPQNLVWISLVVYVVSLFLPGIIYEPSVATGYVRPTDFGYQILSLGWLGIFYGYIAWYANPLYFIALVVLKAKAYRTAFKLSIASILVGLTALLINTVPANEGGGVTAIRSFGIGYYIWLVALAVQFYAIIVEIKSAKTPEAPKDAEVEEAPKAGEAASTEPVEGAERGEPVEPKGK